MPRKYFTRTSAKYNVSEKEKEDITDRSEKGNCASFNVYKHVV